MGKESSQAKIGVLSCSGTSGICTPGITNPVYGSGFELLRVDVANSTGQPCVSPTTALIAYPCPTGTVIATANGSQPQDVGNPPSSNPGTYILNGQGYAEDQYLQLFGGTYNLLATYRGDNNYAASTSAPVPVTISKAPTTITVSGPSSVVGSSVNLTITINTQSYGAAPGGTIELLNNGTNFGGSGAPGTAYSSTTGAFAHGQSSGLWMIAPGQASITAQYSGDGNDMPATSTPISVTVADYTLSANPSSINISVPGQVGTSTVALTPAGGFTGIANLTCSVPPFTGLTCSFSSPTVSLSGTAAIPVTLSVNSTGNSSVKPRPPQPKIPPLLPQTFKWLSWFAVLLALAALMGLVATRRKAAGWVFATLLLVVVGWAACGGGSGGNGGGGGGGGSSSGPVASFYPTSVTFGSQSLNSTSTAQSVTLSNVGNASLSIDSIGISGTNPGDFAETNNCGTTVGAGASCGFNVTFTPKADGSRLGSILLIDNAPGSPQTLGLSGTGVGGPQVSLSTSSINFGQVALGSASAAQTVTVTNSGNAVLILECRRHQRRLHRLH